MKLLSLSVRNVRSLAPDPETGAPFSIDAARGLTVLIGPNNCGKSNVVRALELALDPSQAPDPHLDSWQRLRREPIRIELRFAVDVERPTERRIVELVGEASDVPGTIVHRTTLQFTGDRYERTEDFGDKPDTPGADPRRIQRAVDAFHDSVRLVVTRSGEPVASVLSGRFRNELASIVHSRFAHEHAEAMRARDEYLELLDSTLFEPLTDWLTADIRLLFPDVSKVRLRPSVPEIDDMVATVALEVEDAVSSGLTHKGSGVQSGVVAALLRYLAEHSDRSTVFAVEEPEAVLHPEAQEAIRDQLAALGTRADMSVIVTTHSPFTVPRTADTTVVALAKGADGRTTVVQSSAGDGPLGTHLGGIFRDEKLANLIDAGARVPPDARGVLVVEGTGDEVFLTTAARVLGLESCIEGVHIVPAGGVNGAVVQLVMLAAQSSTPVGVLFDNDDIGKKAFDRLASSTFSKLTKQGRILSYRMAFQGNLSPFAELEVEAEDLFTEAFQSRFEQSLPSEIETRWDSVRSVASEVADETEGRTGASDDTADVPVLRRLEAVAHKGEFKSLFMDFVSDHLAAEDAARWKPLLKRIEQAFPRQHRRT